MKNTNRGRGRNVPLMAINHYGLEAQTVVAMEEMAELIQALSKSRRGVEHNVEEEIADVEIMLAQLRCVYNCDEIERIKALKLEVLEKRMLEKKKGGSNE